MCVRVRPFWKTDFSALIKMSDQTRSSPPSSPSLLFACFLMWNSKQLQMYFLSGTHFAERLCPPLLCRVRWRRIVMTLALWDSKWAEFKCSLYITGPVSQQRPVPGLQAEGAKKCAHVWLYVANPDEGGGVGKVHLEAWIKAPKLGAVQNSLLLCIPPTPRFVGMAETSI